MSSNKKKNKTGTRGTYQRARHITSPKSTSTTVKAESSGKDKAASDKSGGESTLQSEDSEANTDTDGDVDALLATNPMFAVDVAEGNGDEAALPQCTAGDVALDMDVKEVEEEEVESDSDSEVNEVEEDTDTDDKGGEIDNVVYRDL